MNEKNNFGSTRLLSIDALRGFDMIFIMGLAWLITCLANIWPGSFSDALIANMKHPAWDGLSHHDTIFPLFLFIAGMSFPFSWAKHQGKGLGNGSMYVKIIRRVCMMIFLGLVYNGLFHWDFANLRCASVLARIGIAWGIAAVLFMNFKTSTRAIIAAVILVGYGLLSALVAAPDAPVGASPLSKAGCFAGYVDRLLLPGRMYRPEYDPEGLLGCLPATVTAMLGMFTGDFVKNGKMSGNKKTLYMLAAGVVLLVLGLIAKIWIPVNKALWSSSFTLIVGSYSVLIFALFYWIIDVRGWRGWAKFFSVIGVNSITIYLGQEIIPFSSISNFFVKGFAEHCLPALWIPVALSVGTLAAKWFFLWFLDKKNVHLKI